MRFSAFSAFLALFVLLSGCAVPVDRPAETFGPGQAPESAEYVPATPEIARFLDMYAGRPERLTAARFLAANLPPADRASMTAGQLAENLDYAFLARETMPWGPSMPTEVFLHYVLPHRLSQEPFQPNRKRFYDQLAPLVADCADMAEALARVNAWCAARTGFRTTSRWDQGALTTIRRGFGRCEENLILFAAAARAVGLPVRQAMVPYWQHSNDNHTWAEVWMDGAWRHLEAAQIRSGPDKAWFTDPARRAPLVLSLAYGSLSVAEAPILKRGPGYTLINTTAAYAPARELEISVTDGPDEPVPGAEVAISLFNYGSFRPALRLMADMRGVVRLDMGLCTALVTVAHEDRKGFAFARMEPGREPVRVVVDVSTNRLPEGEAVMRMYHPGQPDKSAEAGPDPALEARAKAVEEKREAFFAGFKPLAAAYLVSGKTPEDFGTTPEAKALPESRGNLGEIMRALDLAQGPDREALWEMLKRMAPKDLVSCIGQDMAEDAALAVQARGKAKETHGVSYDTSMFFEYVAAGRIEYEPWSFWRGDLAAEFALLLEKGVLAAAREINAAAASMAKSERGALGPMLTPSQVLSSRSVGLDADRAVFAAAGLRALGLPARYAREWGLVEFFDGERWQPCFPDRPGLFGQREATPLSRAYYAEPASVAIRFTLDGKPCTDKEMAYIRDFAIARFTDKGFFLDLRDSVQGRYDPEQKAWTLRIPPGTYTLFAARRNARGEAVVRMIPFTADSNKPAILDVALPNPR